MPKKQGGHGLLDFSLGAISAGAILSIVAGGYKIAEFLVHAKRLKEVGHENAVYVRIMERVRLDLAECDRLLNVPEVKMAMRRSPDKLGWIQRTLVAMRVSIEEMHKYTRRVQADVESGGWIGLRTRFYWVLDESEKALHCRGEVGICHEGLLEVLGFLSSLEPLPCDICETEKEELEEGGRYEDPERYEDPDRYDDQQRRYEEQARFILQEERGGQYREKERGVQYREREEEVQYRETGEDVEYQETDRSERRRDNERYEGERGERVEREVRVSRSHEEYVPSRGGRDRVVYDREERDSYGPQEEGPARLRVHWPSNL